MYTGIIFSVIFLLIILVIVVARKRISLAIQVIEEASKAVRAMPMIVFLPLVKYTFIVLLCAWFIWIFA